MNRPRGMASRYSNDEQTSVSSNQSVDTEENLQDACLNKSTSTSDSGDESNSNEFWFVDILNL